MTIKKIIVELADVEATFHEFTSVDGFLQSQLYVDETQKVTDAEVIVPETPVVIVDPEVVPAPVETPVTPTE